MSLSVIYVQKSVCMHSFEHSYVTLLNCHSVVRMPAMYDVIVCHLCPKECMHVRENYYYQPRGTQEIPMASSSTGVGPRPKRTHIKIHDPSIDDPIPLSIPVANVL